MKTLVLILLCFVSFSAHSENDADSLNVIRQTDLLFHSDFEKSVFQLLGAGVSTDFFKLALASDPNITAGEFEKMNEAFSKTVIKIKNSSGFVKKPKKQVKFVFESLHDEFLKLYAMRSGFSEIFENGNFNCLNATLMYAIAFERLGIPFEAKILPNHSYLIAYPGTISQVVETTNPLKGTTMVFDSRKKANSVQELVNLKLVSQEEVDEKGVDRVFSDNYLGEETVDMKQLIGALYYNAGLLKLEAYHYLEAYELLKKSSFLYPKKITTSALLFCLGNVLNQRDYDNTDFFSLLAELERFFPFGVPESSISDEFSIFMEKKTNDEKFAQVDSAYTYLAKHLDSESLKNELCFSYHYAKAISLYTNSQLNASIENIELAMEANPNNKPSKDIYTELILEKIRKSESIFDALDLLEAYSSDYEYLNETKKFISFYQSIFLDVIKLSYFNQDPEYGEYARAEFETVFPPEKITEPGVTKYLEQIYSLAAMYYFGKNQLDKAKSVLLKGLEYAPESYELKSKLNALK